MLRVKSLKLLNGKEIDLTLLDGESYSVQGPNGSGKSLLLKSLARLIPASFDIFEYENKNIEEWPPEIYRSQVMYVSATPYFAKDMTVPEFFSPVFQLSVYKNVKSDFDHIPHLKKWNLENQTLSQLSTGQRQMISLLRVLTLKPKIILLDEPTANLDQERTLDIERLMLSWRERTNGSLVWITHSDTQAERLNFKSIKF